jgi:hypothetical protein
MEKISVKVAARTSQADTVQYKNNEGYNTQKKNSNSIICIIKHFTLKYAMQAQGGSRGISLLFL